MWIESVVPSSRWFSTGLPLRSGVLLSLSLPFFGCGSTEPPRPEIYQVLYEAVPEEDRRVLPLLDSDGLALQGSPASKRSPTDLALLNRLRTQYYRRSESAHYRRDEAVQNQLIRELGFQDRPWPEDLPRLCIAFSGGGLRSAAVSMGVLQGLIDHNPQALTGVDVISAVSGGAYTLSWIYYQSHFADAPPESAQPTRLEHSFMTTLLDEEAPYIRAVESETQLFANWGPKIFQLMGHFLVQPILALGHFVGGIPHVDGGGIIYYVDILNAFHTPPGRDGVIKLPLLELPRIVEQFDLPVPVVSAAAVSPSTSCEHDVLDRARLSDAAFEMTPYRAGNEGLGYTEYFLHDDFSDLTGIVVASGAALDQPGWTCQLQRLFGLKIGIAFRGLLLSDGTAPSMNEPGDVIRRNVRLVDGGFIDNLGLYPLVRRGCQNVLVVDSTYDPAMLMSSYKQLQARLQPENGLRIEISAPTLSNTEAANPAPPDFVADRVQAPVLRGTIGPIPFAEFDPLIMQVAVLKLSLNKTEAAASESLYSPVVIDWYRKQPRNDCERSARKEQSLCYFPHKPTRFQSYSADEFRAYRHLGRDMLEQLVESSGSEKP